MTLSVGESTGEEGVPSVARCAHEVAFEDEPVGF